MDVLVSYRNPGPPVVFGVGRNVVKPLFPPAMCRVLWNMSYPQWTWDEDPQYWYGIIWYNHFSGACSATRHGSPGHPLRSNPCCWPCRRCRSAMTMAKQWTCGWIEIACFNSETCCIPFWGEDGSIWNVFIILIYSHKHTHKQTNKQTHIDIDDR